MKNKFYISIILFILFLISCSFQNKKIKYNIPEELNNKINFYLEQFNKFPDENIFLINIANILNEYKYFDESMKYLNRAESNNPKKDDLIKILELKINILETKKRYNDAITAAISLLNINNVLENHLLLSKLYFENKDYLKSIEILKNALETNPNNIEILNKLGIYFIKINQFDEAEKYLLKVVEKDFANITAHYYLTVLYNKIGDMEKYRSELNKVITFGAGSNVKEVAFGYGILAQEYENQNNYDSAIEYIKKALAVNPNIWEIHYKYALLEIKKENFMDAIESLKIAANLNKDNYIIPEKIGDIYYENLNLNKFALQYYLEALELNNSSIRILNRLGNIFYDNKEYNKSIYYFEKITDAAAKDNFTFDAYMKIISILNFYENYNVAIKRCNEALKLFKDEPNLYFQLAQLQEKINNLEEAKNNYIYAIQYNEKFDSAYLNLARVYYKTGHKELAAKTLEKILDIEKSDDVRSAIEVMLEKIKNSEILE